MRHLDLCAGIGGMSLGFEAAGISTAAFCEIEPFCQDVLRKHWPDTPIFSDIKELTSEKLDGAGIGPIDIISAGFPCQPFSNAGKRRGADDDRHLWPEVFRVIREVGPRYFVGENVTGIISMGLGEVLSDLASAGYCVGCAVVPACAVNAPHRRDRVWIMAYRDEPGLQGYRGLCADSGRELPAGQGSGSELGEGQSERGLGGAAHGISTWLDGSWEGQIPRVIKGQKGRVPRLKALGNAVVPKLAQAIGHGVMSHAERG